MNLLGFVLELYRLAQEVPSTDFQDLALEMLKAVVPFRAATWSDAEVTARGVEIRAVHLHNEPAEVRLQFSALNRTHTRRLEPAFENPGHVHLIDDATAFYDRPDEAPMHPYLKRYEHDRNALITDRSQWISLYRPYRDDAFTGKNAATIDLLTPHLIEALKINRALRIDAALGETPSHRCGGRALVDHTGAFLFCAKPFIELLRLQWGDWDEPRIPPSLLCDLTPHRSAMIADGAVQISAQACGSALLLLARRVSPLARLSPRELEVARQFGFGKSYKVIALETQLAPATVRNVLQKAYRKLQIDNKAALARLLQMDT